MGKKSEKKSHASCASSKVLPFYSDKPGKAYREFSNFFRDMTPYEFTLPPYARIEGFPSTVTVEFSEKAIMLVKAGLFNDKEIFENIRHAEDPTTAKKLGRGVRNFDVDVWEKHLEETAFQCVLQKFASSARLRKLLLETGDKILAEAAPNDRIWGIGLATTDDRAYYPEKWCGRNVLGFALMNARSRLRGDTKDDDIASSLSTSLGLSTSSASTTGGAAPSSAEDGAAAAAASAPVDATKRAKRWARSNLDSKEQSGRSGPKGGYVDASMLPPSDSESGGSQPEEDKLDGSS